MIKIVLYKLASSSQRLLVPWREHCERLLVAKGLTVNTSIPVCFTKYHIIVHPPASIFEMLNFKRCNYLSLQCALRDINWGALISLVLNEDYFNVFMREITKVCIQIVPKARSTHCHISSLFKERKGMMKRRTKLRKSLLRSHSQQNLNKLMSH